MILCAAIGRGAVGRGWKNVEKLRVLRYKKSGLLGTISKKMDQIPCNMNIDEGKKLRYAINSIRSCAFDCATHTDCF